MTGISSLAVRRAVLSLERNTVRFARCAHVHSVVGLTTTLPFRPMLGRATLEAKRSAAANQSSRTPANNASLAKQLFPSSSPSPAPKKQNTIVDMMANRRPPPSSRGPPKSATTAVPLQSRSLNVVRPHPPVANGKALASLCNKSDSFREEPDVIDLMDDRPRARISQTNNLASFVQYDEDDLSDDENLALKFEPASALPTVPRPASHTTNREYEEPPPASNTSALTWSQSSPSHYQPPPSKPVTAPPRTVKRASLADDELAPPATKKSKRELPGSWGRQLAAEVDDFEGFHEEVATTPAQKTKSALLWNTTASAVKAQKKQLKNQLKESGKAEASAEDMHEAMKSHTPKQSAITLSNEQRHVKSLVVDKGQSVFFTGPAGTGKSVLMRAIIQELKKKHARDPERVAVTASTGLAACNIGGMTLHSFAGIGLGKEDANVLVKKIRRNPKAKNRWLKTKILIIDEISMVDGELFDKLSQIGRIIRNNGRSWGGIQLVITGDFFQLPPVPDGAKQRESKFAFDAATWSMSIDHTIGLTEVFRQRDPGKSGVEVENCRTFHADHCTEFAQMLNEMRLGKIGDQTVRNFQALSRPLRFDDGLEVTELSVNLLPYMSANHTTNPFASGFQPGTRLRPRTTSVSGLWRASHTATRPSTRAIAIPRFGKGSLQT